MDERSLEVFVAVAEELSVTRAATRVHAAQSTVSAALRSLERDLGAVLFERTTRSMRLTAAGERAVPAAREALAALARLRSEAREPAAGLRGRVRVGLFPALDALEVPAAASAFQERHPDVELTLVASPAGSTGLHEDVRRGRLDLAFSALPRPADLAGRLLDELRWRCCRRGTRRRAGPSYASSSSRRSGGWTRCPATPTGCCSRPPWRAQGWSGGSWCRRGTCRRSWRSCGPARASRCCPRSCRRTAA
ncbi:LysR family transcriptional regulator [Nocardioides sp. ChNu-153]|nr:LysR family transcriptional regulator [Nocardioides sp. ChNu-99]MDN7120128.1 LysR family transcriptional regulator [Nocardioides sp. ChNu-153]